MKKIPTKIEYLRDVVSKSAGDKKEPFLWRDLVIELLHEGHHVEAVKTISDAFKALKMTLTLPEKFHKPVLGALREHGELKPLETLCRNLDVHYDVEDDEAIKRMIRRSRRAIRVAYHGSAFPTGMPEEEWWADGAHLVHRAGTSLILPGRVIKVLEDKSVRIMLMSLCDITNTLEVEYVDMPVTELGKKAPKDPLNKCIEMGVHEDGEVTFVFHKKP